MSIWIAKQLGNDGNLLGIDNNQYQIKACNRLAQNHKLNNCEFKELSAYDIESLNQQFDLVYSRFLLHHLNEPDRVIKSVYDVLKPNGIFICEEGITSFGFAYPPNKAFIEEPESDTLPDKNIGKKLYTKMYQTGFRHLTAKIQHPVLTTQQEKSFLLECLLGSKKTFLASGKNEAEWQKAIKDNQKLANDDESIIGFYASCQVAGTKI